MVTAAHYIGTEGEAVARAYLENKGLQFVSANWLCRAGEIDLIMRDGSILVFVEVRSRALTGFGDALETIGQQKQQRLLRAARFYQQKEDYWGDVRFDVISLTARERGQYRIEHIEDAFTE